MILKQNTRLSGGASREITCWHQALESSAWCQQVISHLAPPDSGCFSLIKVDVCCSNSFENMKFTYTLFIKDGKACQILCESHFSIHESCGRQGSPSLKYRLEYIFFQIPIGLKHAHYISECSLNLMPVTTATLCVTVNCTESLQICMTLIWKNSSQQSKFILGYL